MTGAAFATARGWVVERLGALLVAGSALIAIGLLVVAASGLRTIGISNDEPGHVERTNNWIHTGWYLPSTFLGADGEVVPSTRTDRLHTYGGAFSLSAHAVGVVVGAEPAAVAESSRSAYLVRHAAVLALAAGGAVAVGYATLLATRRRSIACWSVGATLAMPLWTGYGLFAVKDIPAGAGWTFVTAGSIAVLIAGAHIRHIVAGAVLVYVGVWFSVGTRTGLWVPVGGSVVVASVMAWLRRDGRRDGLRAVGALAGPAVAAMATIAVVHRHNAATPVTWLWSGFTRAAEFDDASRLTLTAGHLLPTDTPWWYLPAWFAASVPLLLGLMALGGAGCVVRRLAPGRRSQRAPAGGNDGVLALWMMQAFALPVAAIVLGSTLYGGLRHHVYAFPAMAALASWALHRSTARRGSVAVRSVIGIVAIAALAGPAIDQVTLRPYGYVYKNELAGTVDRNWETDLHWVSGREAMWRVPTGEPLRCYRDSTLDPATEATITDCSVRPQMVPFLDEQGKEAAGILLGDRVWVIARMSNGSPPIEGCDRVADVTRRLRFQEVTLSYVLACDRAALDGAS